ncbi:MAG: hypothetical protein IPG45_05880 [Deltaproteobacteria bacterium]|nr:hypothetical protein [Deltaproteobacteria bacterium]
MSMPIVELPKHERTHLEVRRTHARFIDPKTAVEGRRVVLTVYSRPTEGGADRRPEVVLQLPAIERGGNYVFVREGEHELEASHWVPRSDPTKRIEALRFWIDGKRTTLLVHVANFPSQLEGCVAPGLTESKRGVNHSAAAMAALFEALGGWVEGRRWRVVVVG